MPFSIMTRRPIRSNPAPQPARLRRATMPSVVSRATRQRRRETTFLRSTESGDQVRRLRGVWVNQLLARILEAHGGMSRWRGYEKVEATIVSGGGLFALKGIIQDSTPRRMTAWLHEERSSVSPFGAPDQRTMFTPDRIAIEKLDGSVVAERHAPRDSFAGHQMH